ncbi:hypothetical protein [Lactiplantibacillus plantarum]|uniref:hypothetical protein n=1 Tax=Lactiplantibacillus plantarum TaxID=1590 RepID=UPI00145615DA|nr:hypothetical protein [Lactiplantibacillus plantarum]NLS62853.1 hypothetical protein [Lactiplantibacillus plantarum]
MDNQILADYLESVVEKEVVSMLAPLVQKIVREYILFDRKTAADSVGLSESKFDELRKLPQIALVEHKLPNNSKVLFVPEELKKAIYSILE